MPTKHEKTAVTSCQKKKKRQLSRVSWLKLKVFFFQFRLRARVKQH